MTDKSPKPVKRCEGCLLNLGDRCLAFYHPAEKWAHGDCEGYNNQELLTKYGVHNDGQGAHARKVVRKDKSKYEHTIEHPEEHTKFKKIKFP